MQRFEQDGDVFDFPDDCAVISAYDDQPFFKKLSGNHAIEAKGCDIVMVHGSTLWLIEAKDYDRKEMARTRPNSADLARTIARKGFDTLAGLQVGARYVPDERTAWICHQAVDCERSGYWLSVTGRPETIRSVESPVGVAMDAQCAGMLMPSFDLCWQMRKMPTKLMGMEL